MALIVSMLMVLLAPTLHVYATTIGSTPGGALSPKYYDGVCISPDGIPGTLKFQTVTAAIVTELVFLKDLTLIPSLARLVFHDGWVEGAEASVLLNYNSSYLDVEKDGIPNINSLRGFDIIDAVKTAMENICPGKISCADILQETARAAMAGVFFEYIIEYGRRDGNVSLASETLQLPAPIFGYAKLVENFATKNFTALEMLILSGAHTFGRAHCAAFANRLYNYDGTGPRTNNTDPSYNSGFAATLKTQCPLDNQGNVPANTTVPLNSFGLIQPQPFFTNQYYQNILNGKVLFTSDNALLQGDRTNVTRYAQNNLEFLKAFTTVLVKLTELNVILSPHGEVRLNCTRRN